MMQLVFYGVLLLIMSGCLAHEPYFKYRYQFHYRYDGTCAQSGGAPAFSTTGPAAGVAFLKDYVVNGAQGGGTDAQVLAYRDKALAFFSARFGINATGTSDPAGTVFLSADSVMVPLVLDSGLNARVMLFAGGTTTRGFTNATQLDGGYWIFVGPAGLPAGGSYGKSLTAGAAVGYGALAVQNVCPQIRGGCPTCCQGSKGQLLVNYQSDMPLYFAKDAGWNVAKSSSPGLLGDANMIPIQLSVSHSKFGKGLCSGIFYAVPYNSTMYNMLHNSACFFPPPPGYII